MSRSKNFKREDVLVKSIPVFWKKGFTNTGLQDLEKATGVNKSGLYSEFEDKEDIYVESLRHYIESRGANDILEALPLGWNNIEKFLKMVFVCMEGQGGCYMASTIRELPVLPPEASEMVNQANALLKKSVLANIEKEKTKADPNILADIVMTFFIGISIEQNLKGSKASSQRKIENFISVMKNS